MSDVATGALILYKGQPAIVGQAGRKLDIRLNGGQTVSVRPKDIALLHPGPITSLSALHPCEGEPLVAWELLQGQTVDLATLADLIYGEITPSSAWAAWELVDDGLLFHGSPDAIEANDAATRNALHARREARAAEEAAWSAFLARVEARQLSPQDSRYLAEVEAVALGQSERSRVLDQLGHSQTPEAAHAFLLDVGYWDDHVNPYPSRTGVITTIPDHPLPPLPDEPRLDLTHLVALAIDDEGSTDPDDALSYEDGWLWVHVADAAALITPDSPADREARARAANLYLPEGAVPMLPPEATAQLGLGLNDVSPALSFGMRLDDNPAAELRITPSWVRVRRLSYDEAQSQLDTEPLAVLSAVANQLSARRVARGSVEIDLPEARVRVAETGEVDITPLPSLHSRDIVREAMLYAGEMIGRYALAHEILLPYTVQDPPYEFDPTREGPSGMFARRRAMQRGRQVTTAGPHSGLGLEIYVQATSPLRRYLDLVVHQQLRAHLRGEPALDSAAMLQRIGEVDDPTRATRQAERLSIAHWTCVYLRQHPDWHGEAVAVDERNGQVTFLIPELGWETQLRPRSVPALDSPLLLELTGVDLPQRETSFRPAA
jgi:exoribonuclease-2